MDDWAVWWVMRCIERLERLDGGGIAQHNNKELGSYFQGIGESFMILRNTSDIFSYCRIWIGWKIGQAE